VWKGRETDVRGHLHEGSAVVDINRLLGIHLRQVERKLPHLPVWFPQMDAMRNHQEIG
jgi:hypothetical protein